MLERLLALSHPERPRAACIAVHGLNTNARVVFADLAEVLAGRDVATYALVLAGHEIDPALGRTPTDLLGPEADFGRWVAQVRDAVQGLSSPSGLPLYGLGYSIGAAALLVAIARGSPVEHALVLAPSLRLTWLARIGIGLHLAVSWPFGAQDRAWRRSAVPPRVRANAYVSPTSLATGFQAERAWAGLAEDQRNRLRGRVTAVMRPGDRVVSARQVHRALAPLDTTWVSLPNSRRPRVFNHEVYDRHTLGDSWAVVEQTVRDTVAPRE